VDEDFFDCLLALAFGDGIAECTDEFQLNPVLAVHLFVAGIDRLLARIRHHVTVPFSWLSCVPGRLPRAAKNLAETAASGNSRVIGVSQTS